MKEVAKAERERLRELKRQQTMELERVREDQNKKSAGDNKAGKWKFLLAQTEVFAHFLSGTKAANEAANKGKRGRNKSHAAEESEDDVPEAEEEKAAKKTAAEEKAAEEKAPAETKAAAGKTDGEKATNPTAQSPGPSGSTRDAVKKEKPSPSSAKKEADGKPPAKRAKRDAATKARGK